MSKLFDFKRFGRYFTYDLYRAGSNFGLSLIILALLPAVFYFFINFAYFITHVSEYSLRTVSGLGTASLMTSWLVIVMVATSKIYGNITERKAGSEFRLLPASVFEKWLSMLIIMCIVIPAVTALGIFVCDSVLGFVFNGHYYTSFDDITSLGRRMFEETSLQINIGGMVFLSWLSNVMVFTLGAICFKKNKAAKTLLCLMALGMLFSMITVPFIVNNGIENYLKSIDSADGIMSFISLMNIFLNVSYVIVIGGLGAAIYYRLKTLSH